MKALCHATIPAPPDDANKSLSTERTSLSNEVKYVVSRLLLFSTRNKTA